MQTTQSVFVELPPEFETGSYLLYNPDLSGLSAQALAAHYETHGRAEGRRANALGSRIDFAGLILPDADALEIGPFCSPLLHGRHTKYFEVLPQATLRERAESFGIPAADVPRIDYVSPTGDLSVVDRAFDVVLSSHCLEHQPDVVGHLRAVERLLRPGGRYFLLIPDRRYCFDHYLSDSSLADVVEAFEQRRTYHTLKSVLEHRVLTTHNDSRRHWAGDHGTFMEDFQTRMAGALAEYGAVAGGYVDVHAWYFTPESARTVFAALRALDYTRFEIERLYPTRRGENEFWLVLRS
jgi:SAM-dependent methyltransferase